MTLFKLVALALGAGFGMVAVWMGVSAARSAGPVLVAAHRGGAQLWPENSLLAFRKAVELGADYLELDVHLTRDGGLVVIHDPTLERTTTGAGPVRERALAELASVRLKDRAGAVTDERLPMLDDVVQVAAKGKRRMLLEIKVDEREQRYPGIEEKVLAVLDRHAMAPSVVVMAFEAPTWRRVRALRPDVMAGALYSPRTLAAMNSDVMREMEEAQKAGVGFVGLHQALVSAATVGHASRLRLLLGAWTVNEDTAIRRMIDVGADVVISDRPDLVIQSLGAR